MTTPSPAGKDAIREKIAEFWYSAYHTGMRVHRAGGDDGNELKDVDALMQLFEDTCSEVISSGQTAIDNWAKHAYSFEAFANDTIVYSSKASKERLQRRNDDVTDRRAILLSSHLLEEQRATLARKLGKTEENV